MFRVERMAMKGKAKDCCGNWVRAAGHVSEPRGLDVKSHVRVGDGLSFACSKSPRLRVSSRAKVGCSSSSRRSIIMGMGVDASYYHSTEY
jgi:hypothetical protein